MAITQKYYVAQNMGSLTEYYGCTIKRDLNNKRIIMSKTGLIKYAEKNFTNDTKQLQVYNKLGSNHTCIERKKESDKKLDKKMQSLFRIRVGSLLYIVKHSRLEIANDA